MDKTKFMNRVFRSAEYKLSSPYGYRIHPITGVKTMHWGEDYSTGGKNVVMYSPVFGTVKKISYDSARGKYIDIKCSAGIVRMQHCDNILTSVGNSVSPSTKVAICGKTGASTGIHLHIEYRTFAYLHISPDKFLPKYSDPVAKTGSFTTFVKGVQSATGSKEDGIPGTETFGNTVTISRKTNSRHKVVKVVQQRLKDLGYYTGIVDGVFGEMTENAVKAYQKKNTVSKGGAVDGIMTAEGLTWKVMLHLYNKI